MFIIMHSNHPWYHSCIVFTKLNAYVAFMQNICVLWWDNEKSHLWFFVTFYFWNSLKHLKLCPNKLWSVKCVLWTSVKYRVWFHVKLVKIWAPKLNLAWFSTLSHFLLSLKISVEVHCLGLNWHEFHILSLCNFGTISQHIVCTLK